MSEINRKEKRTTVTKIFDVEKQKKQNRQNMIDESGSAQVIELQKRLQGINRCGEPGEPMPAKSWKYISDVMLQNVLTCPEGLEDMAGKGRGTPLAELWDSWSRDGISLNGRGWVSQDIRLCHNQGKLFKADVYTLGETADLVSMDAINKSRLNSVFFCSTL